MTCLIRNQYQSELETYGNALGSETAAYGVLCMNNGFTLDKTPEGKDSKLYKDLLNYYGGNETAAIRAKALFYTDKYIADHGDWTVDGKEPSLEVLTNETPKLKTENDAIDDCNKFITKELSKLDESERQSTPSVARAVITAQQKWADTRQKEIMQESQLRLARAFGLTRNEDGSWSTKGTDEISRLRVNFVNHMSEPGEISFNLKSEMVHTVINIGLNNGDACTFNHELAHFYVMAFWDSKLIQKSLQAVSKPKMTDRERIEALVDAITDRSMDEGFNVDVKTDNGFKQFWRQFNNILYKVFKIKTKTYRESLLDQVAQSFLVADTLEQDINDRIYEPFLETMYQTEFQKRKSNSKRGQYMHMIGDKIDETTGVIINSSNSKEKSFAQRVRANYQGLIDAEAQTVRNKDMARKANLIGDKIKAAVESNNVQEELHQRAELFKLFLNNADIEAKELRIMLLNARANRWKQIMYMQSPTGQNSFLDGNAEPYTPSNSPTGINTQDYTFEDLEYAKTDIIGYFLPVVTNIYNALDFMENDGFSKQDVDDIRNIFENSKIMDTLYDIDNKYKQALLVKSKDLIDHIVSDRTELDADHRERLRVNMYKWLNDQMDFGDVSAAELYIGVGSRSKSPIIRALHDFLADMEDEISVATEKKAEEIHKALIEARKEAGLKYRILPYNVQKLIMQLDDRGLPTGDFIDEINRGLYRKRFNEKKDKLLFGKNGLEQRIRNLNIPGIDRSWDLLIDDNGSPIIPEDQRCYDEYKKYLLDMEKWICDNAERRYTWEYYRDRINTLSVPTLKALERINKQMDDILSTVDDASGRNLYKLTRQQLQELSQLQREKDQLGSFYDENDELKNINSEEYRIAYDLMQWNNKVRGKIKYKSNEQEYRRNLGLIKDKNLFNRLFSRISINPVYYSEKAKHEKIAWGGLNSPEYNNLMSLMYQRQKLIHKYSGDRFAEIKWDELFDKSNVELKNRNFWKSLKDIDDRISVASQALYNAFGSRYARNDIFEYKFIPSNYLQSGVPSTSQVFYNDYLNPKTKYYEINKALADKYNSLKTSTDPNDQAKAQRALDDFQLIQSFSVKESMYVPLSIFGVSFPEADIQNEPKFVRMPTSIFSEIDEAASSSLYVNDKFVPNTDYSIQPKESIYKDPRYDIVKSSPKLKVLLDKCKDAAKESYETIPFLGKYDGRLSQIGGRTGQILGRKITRRLGRNLLEFIRREFSVVENDTEFRPVDDKAKRPDGSDIENIPVRFVKRLDKPEYISADVAGSVIQMYHMAQNFKVKSRDAAMLISMLDRLSSNSISSSDVGLFDTTQDKVLKGILDRTLYEKETTAAGVGSDSPLFSNPWPKYIDWIRRAIGSSKDWMKRIGKLRISMQLGMLALNMPSAVISFLDPLISLLIDSVTGKYINVQDVGDSIVSLATESVGALRSLGSISQHSKLTGAMKRFQLSKSLERTYKDMDQSAVARFMSDGFRMKWFSLGDFTVNAINLKSTMHNLRRYDDGHFYHKSEFIRKAIEEQGLSKKEAKRKYKEADTMWDCSEMRDNIFVSKLDANGNPIVSDEEFLKCRKQVRSRSSIYNGIVPDIERTMMQSNIILAFFTMLRNFMIIGLWERFQTYRDFQVATFDKNGNPVARRATMEERRRAKKDQNYYKGGYIFATRQIENAVTWSGLYAMSHTWPILKYGYFLATHKGASKYDDDVKTFKKANNISDQDLYGLQKLSMEFAVFMSLFVLSTYTQRIADEDKDNYLKQLLNLFVLRLGIERYTWYSPQTFMELIQSPTTALSDWKRKLKIFALGADLAGLTSKDINETVKQGAYKGKKRWMYNLFNILSSTGINNWYKSMPSELGGGDAQAIRATTNFYKSIRPEPLNWIESANDSKIKSSKKSKKDKKSSTKKFSKD